MEVPGPGAYDYSPKLTGPRAVMTGKYGESVGSLGPGPGRYSTDSKIRQKTITFRYSMAGRYNNTSKDYGPGPGAYSLVDHRMKKGIKFSRSRRETISRSYSRNTPGPGTYASQLAKGQRAPQ
jgi:hypothetical protein